MFVVIGVIAIIGLYVASAVFGFGGYNNDGDLR